MTWQNIIEAAGGRRRGSNNHPIAISDLCREAQVRCQELGLHELTDELFSLRLAGNVRLWGIRQGRILQLIWYDPRHEVYPLN